jgi:ribosomal protein L27
MKRPEATKKRGTRWFSGQSVVMGVGFEARMETLIGALVEGRMQRDAKPYVSAEP